MFLAIAVDNLADAQSLSDADQDNDDLNDRPTSPDEQVRRDGLLVAMVCIIYFNIFNIQGGPKKLAHFVSYALTSSNIDRFSHLFHCLNQENICNNRVA